MNPPQPRHQPRPTRLREPGHGRGGGRDGVGDHRCWEAQRRRDGWRGARRQGQQQRSSGRQGRQEPLGPCRYSGIESGGGGGGCCCNCRSYETLRCHYPPISPPPSLTARKQLQLDHWSNDSGSGNCGPDRRVLRPGLHQSPPESPLVKQLRLTRLPVSTASRRRRHRRRCRCAAAAAAASAAAAGSGRRRLPQRREAAPPLAQAAKKESI